MAFRREFSDQLPRFQPWTAERVLGLVGSIAGIVALGITFFHLDHLSETRQTYIFVAELTAVCVGLIGYLWLLTRKKLHRYAQATHYVHYIAHVIRDEMAAFRPGEAVDPSGILRDIVNATAQCFSVLAARRCRACVQEIGPDGNVVTVVRDSLTSTHSPSSSIHKIEENTDYDSIWYGKNGCPRYFASNNLAELWRSGKYRNSSFEAYGHPETLNFIGMTIVRKWTLPYKAAIVVPIRYIPEGCPWPALTPAKYHSIPQEKRPWVWGFLCIDCDSRNCFNLVYGPELAAAIADMLFTVLHGARRNAAAPSEQKLLPPGGHAAFPMPHSVVGSTRNNGRRDSLSARSQG